jgi:hypothetical protein
MSLITQQAVTFKKNMIIGLRVATDIIASAISSPAFSTSNILIALRQISQVLARFVKGANRYTILTHDDVANFAIIKINKRIIN